MGEKFLDTVADLFRKLQANYAINYFFIYM